jgi:hypothetical protein
LNWGVSSLGLNFLRISIGRLVAPRQAHALCDPGATAGSSKSGVISFLVKYSDRSRATRHLSSINPSFARQYCTLLFCGVRTASLIRQGLFHRLNLKMQFLQPLKSLRQGQFRKSYENLAILGVSILVFD